MGVDGACVTEENGAVVFPPSAEKGTVPSRGELIPPEMPTKPSSKHWP